jgi:DNA-binding transcriptional MerR regulator
MKSNGKLPTLKSGEIARAAGISADTLSHYEKLGLLPVPERNAAGYRLYSPETLRFVRMIRSAVFLGFSLAELADVLSQRRAGHPPCRKVAQLASQHLKALNQKILDLTRLRDWFAPIVETWESRSQTLKSAERAAFLESLPNPNELNSLLTKGNQNENTTIGRSLTRHPNKLRGRQDGVPYAPKRVKQCAKRGGVPHGQEHF